MSFDAFSVRCLEVTLTTAPRRSEYLSYYVAFASAELSLARALSSWVTMSLQVLGNVSVRASFAGLQSRESGWLGHSPRLGSVHMPEEVKDRDIVGLGITSVQRVPEPKDIDFLCHWDYSRTSLRGSSPDVPGILGSFGVSFLTDSQRDLLDELLITHFLDVTRCGPAAYGLVHIGDCWETGFGRVQGFTDTAYANFSQRLVRHLWIRDEDPTLRTRGVYWANWLSSRQAERLGNLKQFVQDYTSMDDLVNRGLVQEQPDGSLLLLLCRSYKDFLAPHRNLQPWAMERAIWLHRRFARAGLLPGWSPTTPDGRAATGQGSRER